jgi:hypothetical protein
MDSKTQTYYIYALAIVALILLYKVFNWNTYKCRLCAKVNIPGICRDCEAKEGFRFRRNRNRRLRRRRVAATFIPSFAPVPFKEDFQFTGFGKSPLENFRFKRQGFVPNFRIPGLDKVQAQINANPAAFKASVQSYLKK